MSSSSLPLLSVITVQALHIAGHREEALIVPNRMVPQSATATFVVQSDESGVPLQWGFLVGIVVDNDTVVVDVE